jgi:4-amino-4-deoxy-L-arabinose transferase-like glycosyltransferase
MALPRFLTGSRAPLLVALIALVAAAAGLFTLPVLDRDEARFAQASAQMLETGDFVEIYFLDEPRHKKPIGIYWMQAAAVAVTTGEEARQIWAYRLPSVLGAILTALFTYAATARLFGRPAGLAGAGMLAASILLGAEGGIAKTDAMLAATAAAAFWAIVELRLANGRGNARWIALGLWIAMGLGVLIKGPITPVAAGLAVGALVIWERRLNWVLPLLWWPGPVAAALLVLPWLIAVEIATGGAFIREAFLGDLGPKMVSGHESHGAPPGVHLALLPILFAPAMLTLPAGLRAGVRLLARGGRGGLAVKLALCFAVPIWLVFEIAPTKLPHYVLPAYPALAALAGLGAVYWTHTALLWKLVGAVLCLLGVLGGVLVFAGLAEVGGVDLTLTLGLAGLVVLLAIAAVALGLRGRAGVAIALLIASGLSWHISGRGVLAPSADQVFVSVNAADVAKRFQAETGAAIVHSSFTEPSFAFTLGGDVAFVDPGALADLPLTGPAVIAIDVSRIEEGVLPGELDQRRAWLEELNQAACQTDAVAGVNYSRGPEPIVVALYALCADPEGPAALETEPTP